MSYDDNTDFDDANPPEESSNRTFLLVAGILGGLVLLGLLCIGGYLFFRNSSNQQTEATAAFQLTQQQVTIQAGVTQAARSTGSDANRYSDRNNQYRSSNQYACDRRSDIHVHRDSPILLPLHWAQPSLKSPTPHRRSFLPPRRCPIPALPMMLAHPD